MFAMARFSTYCSFVALVIGCNAKASPASGSSDPSGPAALDSVPGTAVANPILTSKPTPALALPSIDEKTLRRSYGAADMRLAPCAKLEKDGTIIGKDCPSNVVVFGPYVRTPGNANLWVTFELQADGPLTVTSDAVSEVGKRFHGLMNEQPVAKGEKRNLGFGVHMSEPASALEARIAIRAEGLARFTIRNLSIRVQ
jgi:hypothetical protein